MKINAALLFLFLISSVATFSQSLSANFKSDITGGCSPIVVNFEDLSTGNPTTWSWDFGNGATSAKQNPSATYFSTGTYTVKLTITNGANTNSVTKTAYITVFVEPKAEFTAPKRNGCTPAIIQFNDQSTTPPGTKIVGWKWDFGDGNTSSEQNPRHIYRTPGSFTVTLAITNDAGCTRLITKPNYIDIIQGVVPSFSIDDPGVCSAPSLIKFNNTSTGPGTLSYQWDLGNGVRTTAFSPSTTYNTNGKYRVSLILASSQGCTDSSVTEITVGKANTDFIIPDKICPKVPVQFLNNSNPRPIKALWEFSNGTKDTLRNGMTVFEKPGTYTIKLTNTYTVCTDVLTKTVTVLPGPKVDFIASDTGKCQPTLLVNFQNKSEGTAFKWDFGEGGSSTEANPTYTYTKEGIFDVTLIATSSNGCTDTLKKKEYIKIKKPIISFPDLPKNGCIPYTYEFKPKIETTDTVISYNWNFGDGGTANVKNPKYTFEKAGTYNVSLSVTTKGGCTETYLLFEAIKVGTKPIPEFTAEPQEGCADGGIQFRNLSKDAKEYRWEFSDGSISEEIHPKHVFTGIGSIDVTLVAINNGCEVPLTKKGFVNILPPVSKFNYRPDCNNRLAYTFTDLSIGAQTWEWDFGDGSPKFIGKNPGMHIFPKLGTYDVTLKTTNNTCSYTLKRTIVIEEIKPDIIASVTEGCNPLTTSFEGKVVNDKLFKSFMWDLGDGKISNPGTKETIWYQYTKPGNFDIKISAIDTFNCSHEFTKVGLIKVFGPVAGFTSDSKSGCKGLITTFKDDTKTNGSSIVNWKWDFGDDIVQEFSTAPFQHKYDSIGDYDVKLIVTDAKGCTDQITERAFVKISTLKADWSASESTCPNAPHWFDNRSISDLPFSYTWDMGDGSIYNTLHVKHAYKEKGSYTVTLKVKDILNCEDSLTKINAVVVDVPKASFDANNFTTYCTPFEAKFINTSTFYQSSFWSLGPGQGTSTQNSPNTYYSNTGTYPIKLVITSAGDCKDSIEQILRVYNPGDGTITYKPLFGCRPILVDFEAFSEMKARFIWDFGDGNVVDTTINKITHTYDNLGDFVPRIILRQPEGCLVPLIGKETIEVIGAKAKFGLAKRLFCDSGYISIIDSTLWISKDKVTGYSWDFGDGATSNSLQPTHQYTAPGIYDIRLAVETETGCKDTMTLKKAVKVVESPLITIGGDSIICVNQSMRHMGVFQRPDTSAVRWDWKFPNGNTAVLQNPLIQKYSPGSYQVTAVATNSSGCTDTAYKNILVHALPTVTLPPSLTKIVGLPVTLPAVYSSGVVGYNWTPAIGLDCSTCPQPEATPKFTTRYTVSAIDSNNCKNTAEVQVKVICEGATIFVPNTFSPNGDGANDIFYVRGKGLDRVKSLRIFNRWGEVVFEQRDFLVNSAQHGWDGKYKGNKPVADVYIYQVEVFCENGEIIRFDGNVALIK